MPGFDVIVLAGGAASRLGGIDKAMSEVGGIPILVRVLDAVAAAHSRVVAGPRRAIDLDVIWCREQPPGAGPRAALDVALPLTEAEVVMLLGADLPWIGPAVPLLLAALNDNPGAGAAALVDAGGRVNFVAAAWRRRALVQAIGQALDERSLRAVYDRTSIVPVADGDGWGSDCDTPDDLEAARRKVLP